MITVNIQPLVVITFYRPHLLKNAREKSSVRVIKRPGPKLIRLSGLLVELLRTYHNKEQEKRTERNVDFTNVKAKLP